jgi:hypothetical protein
VLLFFLVPETAYVRPARIQVRPSPSAESDIYLAGHTETRSNLHVPGTTYYEAGNPSQAELVGAWGANERKTSYLQQLAPFQRRRYSDASFLAILIRPLKLLASPMVAWATVIFCSCFNFSCMLQATD